MAAAGSIPGHGHGSLHCGGGCRAREHEPQLEQSLLQCVRLCVSVCARASVCVRVSVHVCVPVPMCAAPKGHCPGKVSAAKKWAWNGKCEPG